MEMSIMFGYLIGKSVRANHISKAMPKKHIISLIQ